MQNRQGLMLVVQDDSVYGIRWACSVLFLRVGPCFDFRKKAKKKKKKKRKERKKKKISIIVEILGHIR